VCAASMKVPPLAVTFAIVLSAWAQDVEPSADYRKLLAQSPNSSLELYRLGEALVKQNDQRGVARAFRSALRGDLKPAWTEVWSLIALGRIYTQIDRRQYAITAYRAALDTRDNTNNALEEAAKSLAGVEIGILPETPSDAGATDHAANVLIALEAEKQTGPVYSAEARLAGLEGTVVLVGEIDAEGNPSGLRVVRPLGLGLDEQAIEAVRRWRFTQVLALGRMPPLRVLIPVDFFLSE